MRKPSQAELEGVIELLTSDDDAAEGSTPVRAAGAPPQRPPPQKRRRSGDDVVDLTNPLVAAKYSVENERTSKRKIGEPVNRNLETSSSVNPPSRNRTRSLSCPVCLDIVRLPTTTQCGHIFCQECISAAIKSQKKCPTCRRGITLRSVHRIYLP